MKYVLVQYKNVKLLINDGLDMQPLLDSLVEIEELEKEVKAFYQNLLNAVDEEGKKLDLKRQDLISKIGYKIIGVPFTNHDAELYALDKKLDYSAIQLKSQ